MRLLLARCSRLNNNLWFRLFHKIICHTISISVLPPTQNKNQTPHDSCIFICVCCMFVQRVQTLYLKRKKSWNTMKELNRKDYDSSTQAQPIQRKYGRFACKLQQISRRRCKTKKSYRIRIACFQWTSPSPPFFFSYQYTTNNNMSAADVVFGRCVSPAVYFCLLHCRNVHKILSMSCNKFCHSLVHS